MKRFYLVFAALLLAVASIAQPKITVFQNSATFKNPASAIPARSLQLAISPETLQKAYDTPHFIFGAFTLPSATGNSAVELDLEQFSVVGAESHFITVSANGAMESAPPTVHTYRGHIIGEAQSRAVISIDPNGKVLGYIRLNGEDYSIGADDNTPYTALISENSSIPYFSDLSRCEIVNDEPYSFHNTEKRIAEHKGFANPQSIQAATKTAVVAFDADFQAYQAYGSEESIKNYLATLMGMITTVYEDEVDMAMSLGTVTVYTSADPYSGANLDAILNSFTNYWPTHSEKQSIDRTMAHLVTRKLGGGGASGLAWLDVMCDKAHGYGVTNISGTSNFPSLDASVIAHELGHNVGSAHTHNCVAYPPSGIDHCVAADGAGCSWTPQQVTGTIMSYCNNKTFTFHPRVITVMKAAVDAAPCLQSLASAQIKYPTVVYPPMHVLQSKDTLLKDVVKSTGSEPLRILSAQLVSKEGNILDFSLKNLPTFPITLSPGQTQSFTVNFNPHEKGASSAVLYIYMNKQGGKDSVVISGIGQQQVASIVVPAINYVDPITDNLEHDTTVSVIVNDGDAPLLVKRYSLSGDNDNEFSIINPGTPYTLQPNESHSVTIRLKAATNGIKEPALWIHTDDPENDSVLILLSVLIDGLTTKGYSIPNPAVDYGTVMPSSIVDKSFTLIKNEGNTPFHVKKIEITNDVDGEFSITNGVGGFILSPGDSHDVAVHFEAKSNGDKAALLMVYIDQPFVDEASVLLSATVSDLEVKNDLPKGMSLSISPNPTKEYLNMQFGGIQQLEGQLLHIALYDKRGSVVATIYDGKVYSSSQLVRFHLPPSLSAGSYTIAINIGSNLVYRELIVR